jgi:hypothetical protein
MEKPICELNIMNASANNLISPIPTPINMKMLRTMMAKIRFTVGPIPEMKTKIHVGTAKSLR